jgi:predicted GTPase
MIVVFHNEICQDADFEFVKAFLEQIQKKDLVLVLGDYFLGVDTTIHSVVISTFKS